jgi:hypothetical protein
MRAALYVLAALAGTVAGCSQSGNPDVHPIREPDYGYVSPYGYTPSRSSAGSTSKYDYYRNYRGTIHPGPESYP